MCAVPSAAAPLPGSPLTLEAADGIIPVQEWYGYGDCHNRTHNHYVPEWGFAAPHHHVGPYCRPVQDENDMGGVYRDRRYQGDGRYHEYHRYRSPLEWY
jgi:hypothetical protein